jgi:hypothetical protein
LANGLPFLASDSSIHQLLDAHTVAKAQHLQVALGQIRRASGDYGGGLLAIDPHRTRSYSKRSMRRYRDDEKSRAFKVGQTFWGLDADTKQPVCFTTATSACTATHAAVELLDLATKILTPQPGAVLVMADLEHFSTELFDHVRRNTPFNLLVPMKNQPHLRRQLATVPAEIFRRQWAGFATAKQPYRFTHGKTGPFFQFIHRSGEKPEEYQLGAFLSTTDRDETDALTLEYPKRWHVEEFFNADQALGWKRAGTMNLHIRYGQMTMALIAQAVLHRARQRLGEPFLGWDSSHLAKSLLAGLEGDIRVHCDTIVVTYYNAPNAEQLRPQYENLPDRLASEGIDPRIPWLYNFQLDFRFR